MNMKKLQFASPYAGMFLGVDLNPKQIKLTAAARSNRVLVYETVGRQLALVIGDTHTESVSGVLDGWHDGANGSSFVGPIVSKLQLPPPTEMYMTPWSLVPFERG
jgi:hypothetical protein